MTKKERMVGRRMENGLSVGGEALIMGMTFWVEEGNDVEECICCRNRSHKSFLVELDVPTTQASLLFT